MTDRRGRLVVVVFAHRTDRHLSSDAVHGGTGVRGVGVAADDAAVLGVYRGADRRGGGTTAVTTVGCNLPGAHVSGACCGSRGPALPARVRQTLASDTAGADPVRLVGVFTHQPWFEEGIGAACCWMQLNDGGHPQRGYSAMWFAVVIRSSGAFTPLRCASGSYCRRWRSWELCGHRLSSKQEPAVAHRGHMCANVFGLSVPGCSTSMCLTGVDA